MSAGDFATRFKFTPDALSYAKRFLDQGMSYQAAARASGVNELTLREMLPIRKPAPVVVINLPPRPVKVEAVQHVAIRMPSDQNRRIIAAVARKHGLTSADIFGDCRKSPVNAARQEAMHEVRKQSGLSLKAMGRLFGRDHSTIINGLRGHAKRVQKRAPDLLLDMAA